jgi:hypothetical protein
VVVALLERQFGGSALDRVAGAGVLALAQALFRWCFTRVHTPII